MANSRNLVMYNLTNDTEVTLHKNVTGIGTHLTVDNANKTVYWVLFTSETSYKIYRTTYDGQTLQIGPDQTGSVDSIDIEDGIGYFYILSSDEIKKYDKRTDTVAETISLATQATGMIVLTGK